MTRLVFLAPGEVRKARVEPISWMRTCEAFAARGVRVTLVALRIRSPDGVPREEVFRHFDVAETFRVIEAPTFLRHPIGTASFRIAGTVTGAVCAAIVVARAAFGHDTWVVYARAPAMLAPLVALRRLLPSRRRPVLVHETHAMPTRPNLRLIRKVDLVVVNSEHLASELRQEYVAGGPAVAHLPLPPFNRVQPMRRAEARARLGLPLDPPLGCYAGKLVEDQLEFLFQATAAVLAAVPHFRLMVVGGNPSILAWARARLTQLGLGEHVILAGFVAPESVAAHQAAADVLVFHMSERIAHFAYCTPAKGFEYQAMSRPIVATDLPLFEEVFGAHGEAAIKVSRAPEALAAGIVTAVTGACDTAAMAERGRARMRGRTWSRRVDAVLEFVADSERSGKPG